MVSGDAVNHEYEVPSLTKDGHATHSSCMRSPGVPNVTHAFAASVLISLNSTRLLLSKAVIRLPTHGCKVYNTLCIMISPANIRAHPS